MARSIPFWAVYRRVDRDDGAHLVLAGYVEAEHEGTAAMLAPHLPEPPRFPVLARALGHRDPAAPVVAADREVPDPITVTGRRRRKRLAYAALAASQFFGRAA